MGGAGEGSSLPKHRAKHLQRCKVEGVENEIQWGWEIGFQVKGVGETRLERRVRVRAPCKPVPPGESSPAPERPDPCGEVSILVLTLWVLRDR